MKFSYFGKIDVSPWFDSKNPCNFKFNPMVNEPRIQEALNALDQAKDLPYQKFHKASSELNSFMYLCRSKGLNPIKVLEEHYTKQNEIVKPVQPVALGDNPNTGNYVCTCGKHFATQNAMNGHKKGCKS